MSEARFDCTYCVLNGLTPDTKGHLYMNKEKGCYHCKRCGASGALNKKDGKLGFPQYQSKGQSFKNIDLFSFNIKGKLVGGFFNRKKVYNYAIGRLPIDIVMARTMWSPDFPTRWFFPIKDETGKVVLWQARTILKEEEPKYLTCGEKTEYIYNLDCVKDYAVVVEGPINALSTPHGVAVFGKDLSDTQFLLLTHKYDTIYLALDYGAERWRDKMQERLEPFVEVKIIEFEDEKDPNDLGPLEMERRIECLN